MDELPLINKITMRMRKEDRRRKPEVGRQKFEILSIEKGEKAEEIN